MRQFTTETKTFSRDTNVIPKMHRILSYLGLFTQLSLV